MNVKIICEPQKVKDGLMFKIEFSEGEHNIVREYHYVLKNNSIHLQNKAESVVLNGKDVTQSGGSMVRQAIKDYLK